MLSYIKFLKCFLYLVRVLAKLLSFLWPFSSMDITVEDVVYWVVITASVDWDPPLVFSATAVVLALERVTRPFVSTSWAWCLPCPPLWWSSSKSLCKLRSNLSCCFFWAAVKTGLMFILDCDEPPVWGEVSADRISLVLTVVCVTVCVASCSDWVIHFFIWP